MNENKFTSYFIRIIYNWCKYYKLNQKSKILENFSLKHILETMYYTFP